MGMLFSTKATTKMVQIVNDAFDNDSMDFWTTPPSSGGPAPMEWFNASSSYKKTLPDLAIAAKIFGGTGQGSAKDRRFQKWLNILEKALVANDICAQVYQGLLNINVSEIYFVVVPSNLVSVVPNPPIVGGTLVITVSTIEIDKAPAYFKRFLTTRATRTAKKKAAKKKK